MSVYLDLVRFVAAFAVFMGHAVQDHVFDGPLPLYRYSHSAVVIFFVLSGYVIASTATKPGETLRNFAVSRMARIYSVAIPAILLSYVVKCVVTFYFDRTLFIEWMTTDFSLATPLLAMFFLLESWSVFQQLPWNAPYWSVSYEAFYYIIFGLWFFLHGTRRWICAGIAMAVAGPRIMLLFPLWVLGAVLSQIDLRSRMSALRAIFLVGTGWTAVGIIGAGAIEVEIRQWLYAALPVVWRLGFSVNFLTDFLIAPAIAMAFVGFAMLPDRFGKPLLSMAGPIRYLASFTFSLYLFHRPLTKAAAIVAPNVQNSLSHAVGVLLVISLIIFVLGSLTERNRYVLRDRIDQYLPGASLGDAVPKSEVDPDFRTSG